ncbi:MAG: gliding-motility protein MglA [Archangium sp.]|nr:gliding-motility protein MglA [Archangium sp.]
MRVFFVGLLLLTLPASASFINYSAREINLKLVYVSASDAAGRANLEYVYGKTNPEAKGKFISLAVEDGSHVQFFDFLPLSLGEIRGFKVRFHLYTSVGGKGAEATRRLILKGVDGVVFVADGDPKRSAENVRAFKQLKGDLAALGYDWKTTPITVQVQGEGVAQPMTPEVVAQALGLSDQPVFSATPVNGVGVFDTLKSSAKQMLLELKKGVPDAGTTVVSPPRGSAHH